MALDQISCQFGELGPNITHSELYVDYDVLDKKCTDQASMDKKKALNMLLSAFKIVCPCIKITMNTVVHDEFFVEKWIHLDWEEDEMDEIVTNDYVFSYGYPSYEGMLKPLFEF